MRSNDIRPVTAQCGQGMGHLPWGAEKVGLRKLAAGKYFALKQLNNDLPAHYFERTRLNR